jgi:phage terminase Nu1 subunit (DNA packaging protein)
MKTKRKTKTKPVRKLSGKSDGLNLPPIRTAALARMLGVSGKTLGQWAVAGIVVRVGYGKFDLAASISGFAQYMRRAVEKRSDGAGTVASARSRLLQIQADRAEMQLDREVGRLCDVDEFTASIERDLAEIRRQVLSLPTRIAGRGGGLSQAALAIIAEEVDLLLTDLARPPSIEDMPTLEEVAAAMVRRERKGAARDLRATARDYDQSTPKH